MPKVYNKKTDLIPLGAVYVGRPSKWGNPFQTPPLERQEVIALYKDYLVKSGLIAEVKELKGKDLVCWCAPLPCHADILLRLANEEENRT